jgi:hypothetical protein
MRPELERLQRIERHLLGHSAAEASAWAVQELLDADLRPDTEAQRLVYQGLYAAGRRQLRQELEAIHAHLYGEAATRPGRWLRQATAALRGLLRRGRPSRR